MKGLSDYVTPICAFNIIDNAKADVVRILGTAFFIDNVGTFLTARHVIEKAQIFAENDKTTIGIVISDSEMEQSMLYPIPEIEHAPVPWDISIGCLEEPTYNIFCWPEFEDLMSWTDVSTLGYPESASNRDPGYLKMSMRALKGYVTRRLQEDEDKSLFGKCPASYELDFAIPQGMSGSPLIVTDMIGAKKQLYGVCVGSRSTSVVEHQYMEIEENGQKFREKITRVNDYGIAHSILGLKNWRPATLRGGTLAETLR